MSVSFKVKNRERTTIWAIAQRAHNMARASMGEIVDISSLAMDITATHANGTPLRLTALLAADDFNFAHDVFGIRHHINRETGKLDGHFLPRFHGKEPAK